jgi:hypothetical protein
LFRLPLPFLRRSFLGRACKGLLTCAEQRYFWSSGYRRRVRDAYWTPAKRAWASPSATFLVAKVRSLAQRLMEGGRGGSPLPPDDLIWRNALSQNLFKYARRRNFKKGRHPCTSCQLVLNKGAKNSVGEGTVGQGYSKSFLCTRSWVPCQHHIHTHKKEDPTQTAGSVDLASGGERCLG